MANSCTADAPVMANGTLRKGVINFHNGRRADLISRALSGASSTGGRQVRKKNEGLRERDRFRPLEREDINDRASKKPRSP